MQKGGGKGNGVKFSKLFQGFCLRLQVDSKFSLTLFNDELGFNRRQRKLRISLG